MVDGIRFEWPCGLDLLTGVCAERKALTSPPDHPVLTGGNGGRLDTSELNAAFVTITRKNR